MAGTIMETPFCLLCYGSHHIGMIMTKEQAPVAADQVDKLITIDIPFSGPIRSIYEKRKGFHIAAIMFHTAWDDFTGSFVEFL
ncbi:MAG: hypothetical protein A2144_04385 [Chloroflexi bacterium RBG_16_50_9]|nr:MAG: hypothetical protein A2144_04385 [Chloroflexi bacterium RBG_16_50_9]